jgi:hypothetical protein
VLLKTDHDANSFLSFSISQNKIHLTVRVNSIMVVLRELEQLSLQQQQKIAHA